MDSFRDRCVNQVLDFSSCEAWSHLCKLSVIDRFVLGDLAEIQIEDIFSPVDVWVGHVDLLVEAAGSDSGRVQGLLVVCRSDNHDRLIFLEAIHFCKDLI